MSYALIHEIKTSALVIYVPRDEKLRNHNQSDVAADENLATLELLPATIFLEKQKTKPKQSTNKNRIWFQKSINK